MSIPTYQIGWNPFCPFNSPFSKSWLNSGECERNQLFNYSFKLREIAECECGLKLPNFVRTNSVDKLYFGQLRYIYYQQTKLRGGNVFTGFPSMYLGGGCETGMWQGVHVMGVCDRMGARRGVTGDVCDRECTPSWNQRQPLKWALHILLVAFLLIIFTDRIAQPSG